MYLLIDLSKKDDIHLSLFDEEKINDQHFEGQNKDLVFCIEQTLKDNGLKKEQIDGIMTVIGAGGFTSTRIAVVVTNTMAYALKIPILAISENDILKIQELIPTLKKQNKDKYISASYSGEPNITTPKKKK